MIASKRYVQKYSPVKRCTAAAKQGGKKCEKRESVDNLCTVHFKQDYREKLHVVERLLTKDIFTAVLLLKQKLHDAQLKMNELVYEKNVVFVWPIHGGWYKRGPNSSTFIYIPALERTVLELKEEIEQLTQKIKWCGTYLASAVNNSFELVNVDEFCSICQEECEEKEDEENPTSIKITACGHIFHRACLEKYITRGNVSCPVCKQTFG